MEPLPPAAGERPGLSLLHLGFDEHLQDAVAVSRADLVPGRVSRVDRGMFWVITSEGTVRAEGPRRTDRASDEGPAAVGDWVLLGPPTEGVSPIEIILPRHSALVRGDAGEAAARQVVAANVDVLFVTHSLSRPINLGRLERELVLAWESGAAPVVLLTKADLCADVRSAMDLVDEVALDVPVLAVSTVTGRGIADLAAYAEGCRTLAFFGPSGVGKSTLVNRLVGEEVQPTAEVREGDQKGRHTTVARELVLLPHGGVVIDTPGMRGMALWEADIGLSRAFADITALAERCRFRDCGHDGEPGCAVQGALGEGTLSRRRFGSYQTLRGELASLAVRREVQTRQAETRQAGRARSKDEAQVAAGRDGRRRGR